MERVSALADSAPNRGAGRDVAEQVTQMSVHLSTASMHFSESVALVKERYANEKWSDFDRHGAREGGR